MHVRHYGLTSESINDSSSYKAAMNEEYKDPLAHTNVQFVWICTTK